MRQADIEDHLARQDGVICRSQVLECDGTDNDIERLIRRRAWATVFNGVYVSHTGPLSWKQRAWAAVLYHQPAALAGAAALRAAGLDSGAESAPIELVVARPRRVVDPPDVTTRQVVHYEGVVHEHLGPPRVRVEHAALQVASRARTEDAAVAALGDVVQKRRTTAQRLFETLDTQPRLKRRRLLRDVLADVAAGTNSALERRYLRDVERGHGLPEGRRQARAASGARSAYRDVHYEDERTLVELDGRLGHDGTEDRWDDLDRDVASAVDGKLTVRVGWRQVLDPCRSANAVGAILKARGWKGDVQSCPRCVGNPVSVVGPSS
jgi:hypothetical protein